MCGDTFESSLLACKQFLNKSWLNPTLHLALGHWRCHSHGSMDLALEGKDEREPLSVRKQALGRAYKCPYETACVSAAVSSSYSWGVPLVSPLQRHFLGVLAVKFSVSKGKHPEIQKFLLVMTNRKLFWDNRNAPPKFHHSLSWPCYKVDGEGTQLKPWVSLEFECIVHWVEINLRCTTRKNSRALYTLEYSAYIWNHTFRIHLITEGSWVDRALCAYGN